MFNKLMLCHAADISGNVSRRCPVFHSITVPLPRRTFFQMGSSFFKKYLKSYFITDADYTDCSYTALSRKES